MYKDETIHLTGGIHEYIGQLDLTPHPNGANWYRIKNPCYIFQSEDPKTQRINNVIASLTGDKKAYRKFVDIRIPEDSIIEIKVLDKNGELYKVYKKEADRVQPSLIVMPDSGIKTV